MSNAEWKIHGPVGQKPGGAKIWEDGSIFSEDHTTDSKKRFLYFVCDEKVGTAPSMSRIVTVPLSGSFYGESPSTVPSEPDRMVPVP